MAKIARKIVKIREGRKAAVARVSVKFRGYVPAAKLAEFVASVTKTIREVAATFKK